VVNGQSDLSAPTSGSAASGASASGPRTRSAAGSVGVLLDGRYRLLQRRTKDGAAATWDGEDDQLLRPVVIHVVSGATAAEAVDAARRSAAVEDERLPHLLDVGLDRAADGSALGWVVTERSPGRTLADLLREAPLPASRARALVGEAAAVLARASRSGLHHRRLDPSSVALTADGAVSVLGLEIASAAAGLPPRTPAEAEREDAEGLVRLLYAALTGLWPAGRSGSLGAAPTGRGGAPVAPGQLSSGVPDDLDALCAAVLGPYREGPATPSDVAAVLAPWGSSTGPVTRTGLGVSVPESWPVPDRATAGATGASGGEPSEPAEPPAPSAWSSAPVRARLGGGPGLHFAGSTGAGGAGGAAAGAPGAGTVPETRASRRAAQRRAEREAAGADAFEALLGPVSGPRPAVPPAAPVATAPVAQPGPRASAPSEHAATTQAAPARPSRETAAAFDDTDTTDWVGAGWGHAPAGARPVPRSEGRPAPRSRPRTRRSEDHTEGRSEGRPDDRTSAAVAPERARVQGTAVLHEGDRDGRPQDRRRRGPVLAVLGLVAALLVALVVLVVANASALAGVLGIAPSDASTGRTTASDGTTADDAAPGAGASEPAAPGTAETAPAAEVTGATAADPFGDSTENDASASRAVDGDLATAWTTSTYTSAALGNLKRGVGLSLQLGDGTTPSTVTSLSLTSQGTGGTVEVRSSPDGGYEGSTVLVSTAAGTGGQTVEVPLDQPATATHLLLWFTQLPANGTGYAAAVDEVSAR